MSASRSHEVVLRAGTDSVEFWDIPRLIVLALYPPQARGEALSGRLLVAPVKVGARIASVEMIDEAGRKSAVTGGAKRGGFWAAQAMPEGDCAGCTLLIGEGVATVLSAREATGHLALAALSCGT
jgi:putative DNA primase/helicase